MWVKRSEKDKKKKKKKRSKERFQETASKTVRTRRRPGLRRLKSDSLCSLPHAGETGDGQDGSKVKRGDENVTIVP